MSDKLLTEYHLEFLYFKGGCTGMSESTLVKMPHLRKSHVMAHFFQNKVLPHLLKLRQSQDHAVQSQAHQALALVGYVPPPRGRGIRILSVDGGGTK